MKYWRERRWCEVFHPGPITLCIFDILPRLKPWDESLIFVKNAKKHKKVVDKPFKGWYYSQRRRKQDRHNKNNSETIIRIVTITKTIQNY